MPQFTPSREFLLYDWLRDKGLDHYFIGFVQSDLIDLSSISRLNLPDEELYDELEITLPGHKRRLERAGKFKFYVSVVHRTICLGNLTKG